MNKYYLVVLVLVGGLFNSVNASDAATAARVIYKWSSDGETRYGHIKPVGVKEFVKLDSEGLVIEDFTEGFDQIVDLSIRPDIRKASEVASTEGDNKNTEEKSPEEKSKDKEQRRIDKNKKNCEIARKNMSTLTGGEVYERDDKGNMMRLNAESVETKRKNVEKDVSYFCVDTDK